MPIGALEAGRTVPHFERRLKECQTHSESSSDVYFRSTEYEMLGKKQEMARLFLIFGKY